MYELNQSLCALFLNLTEKIYTKSSVDVTIFSNENIPQPTARDIVVVDRGALGKDITIKLNVQGQASGGIKTAELEISTEIIDAGQKLDEQGVRNAIGTKVYNVTTKVFKDNVEKSSQTGKVNDESDVEIE